MIRLLDTGLVYRNPNPDKRSIHAWHPTLVVLGNGELLAGFDLTEAIASTNYRTFLARSSDDGQTWTPPVRLFPDENDRLQRHSVRISRMSDGTLVAMGGRRYVKHEDEDVFSHETFGVLPMELILLRNHDQGKTWEDPSVVQPPLEGPFEICHAVLELDDGRWLLPTSTLRRWDGQAPLGVKAIALVSYDKGQTWTEHFDALDDYANGIIHFEVSMIQLPNHRLLTVSWAFHSNTGISRPLPYAIFEDGQTFGPARPTGLCGETSKLLSLGEDRVLCVYRRYDKPGLWANLACIDGNQWVNLEEAPLWQGTESKMFGERSSAEELSALQFGFPQPHRLSDGNIMVLLWCREDCIHNIRWLRLAVD